MLLTPLAHLDTRSGKFTSGIRITTRVPEASAHPQNLHVPVHIMHPLDLARHDRTYLVAVHFEGAHPLPLLLREAILMLAPGHKTFPMLNPIVPSYLYLCVLLFSFMQFVPSFDICVSVIFFVIPSTSFY